MDLLKIRKTLELTQKEFAEKLGLSTNHYQCLESGKNKLELQTILAIKSIVFDSKKALIYDDKFIKVDNITNITADDYTPIDTLTADIYIDDVIYSCNFNLEDEHLEMSDNDDFFFGLNHDMEKKEKDLVRTILTTNKHNLCDLVKVKICIENLKEQVETELEKKGYTLREKDLYNNYWHVCKVLNMTTRTSSHHHTLKEICYTYNILDFE